MSNQVNSLKKGLTVKDLVTTGIFSAIFFVFTLVGGLPFAPNPVLTFYMPMGAALLCGPIYLLMVAKVQKRWSVTILGIIMGDHLVCHRNALGVFPGLYRDGTHWRTW